MSANTNQRDSIAPLDTAVRRSSGSKWSSQGKQPALLESFLDIEWDQSNQERGSTENEELIDEEVSLELLALLSPHGTRQQWDEEENSEEAYDWQREAAREKILSILKPTSTALNKEVIDLTSPTSHMIPFQPSPCHSAHGEEFDLSSPLALPESPHTSPWSRTLDLEDLQNDEMDHSQTVGQKTIVRKRDELRQPQTKAGPATVPRRTKATKSPQTSSHASSISEQRPKVKHGGIYSLLLKSTTSRDHHEPILFDEKRSPLGPEESPRPYSIHKSTTSSSRLQHGSIYRTLRLHSKE